MPFVTIDSTSQIFYDIRSSNGEIDPSKPIIFGLHPRLFDSEFLAPQYDDSRLSTQFNFLVVDHHYHGKTKTPVDDKPYDFWKVAGDLFLVLDHLAVTSCHIFGASLGALIAVRMAVLEPSRVTSLTLCGMPRDAETPDNLEQFRMTLDMACQGDEEGVDEMPRNMVAAGRVVYFGKWDRPEHIHQKWLDTHPWRPSNKPLLLKVYSALLDRQGLHPTEWERVTMPTLLIHGGNDVQYPVEVAHENYALFPSSGTPKLYIIDEAPHLLSWTHYRQVNNLFLSFLLEQHVSA